MNAFLSTRLEAVRELVNDDPEDDPLPPEEADQLAELEALPALGRLKIDRTASFMADLCVFFPFLFLSSF